MKDAAIKDAAVEAKRLFGNINIKRLDYVSPEFARKYKIVVYVPLQNTDELMYKMAAFGAGNIGKYSLCSFRMNGTGTFKGSGKANPAVGKKNRLEKTEETRLEMICEQRDLEKVIDAVYKYHPYEEPACEIYSVIVKETSVNKRTALIELKRKVKITDIIKKLNTVIEPVHLSSLSSKAAASRVFIDLTGKAEYSPAAGRQKTLVIKKYKNILNIEVI